MLKIPEKRAIIVEAKNMKKYKAKFENIRNKKKLMNTLKFKMELSPKIEAVLLLIVS